MANGDCGHAPELSPDTTAADPAPVTADTPATDRLPTAPYCGTTIAALGRRLHAVNDIHDTMDEAAGRAAFPKVLCRRAIQERAEAERSALSDLILTLPANTLADAAVQLDIACGRAEGLADDDRLDGTLAKFAAQIYRAIVSAGMVVCRSAGLDPTTVAWNDLAATHARVFAKAGASAKEPDDALIAAAAEYARIEDEYATACRGEDTLPEPEKSVCAAQLEAISERQRNLYNAMCDMRPQTPEGLRAKAMALRAWIPQTRDGSSNYSADDSLAWSLVSDILGRT